MLTSWGSIFYRIRYDVKGYEGYFYVEEELPI
jgi:hypothetical protein